MPEWESIHQKALDTEKAWCTTYIREQDIIDMTDAINEKIDALFKECEDNGFRMSGIKLRWINVPHRGWNPDGNVGHIRVYATAEKK